MRLYPTLIPSVKAKVIHIPGVIDTKKNVGIKAQSSALSILLPYRLIFI
ncbi:hypothetical protein VCRA2116E424_180046 [Vibrio crassostreae]|nr:hypothetical protein VCRA2113O411_170047 [Vibrio crassostreae]CAK2281821.1 hypothetical protein VCRA2116E424_180046 [Vibrio crassostreae]CAK2430248.1 hypothetical protein VCRA2113O417_190047 [Vibrio crassostreae]CAK3218987.1 hypothetical protein VCRA2126O446_170047 [Vibrio crassostreae]CAK3728710.1 hypothetical protein VCRA2121O441_160056 [Vibrio crassostreae]